MEDFSTYLIPHTTVTDDEYVALERWAQGRTLSASIRDVVHSAPDARPADQVPVGVSAVAAAKRSAPALSGCRPRPLDQSAAVWGPPLHLPQPPKR